MFRFDVLTRGRQVPQKVSLRPQDFALTDRWKVVLERGVKADDVAVRVFARTAE
jgi:hypothetical protein